MDIQDPNQNAVESTVPVQELAAPAAPSDPPLTADQVKRMIEDATRRAYNSGAADARRAEQAKVKAPQAQTSERAQPPASEAADPMVAIALRDSFDEATEGMQLTAAQKKLIRKSVLANVRDPDHVGAHVQEFVEALGIGKAPPSSAPASVTNNTPPTTNTRTVAMPAPAAPTQASEGDPSFRALSEDAARDTWQAYVRRKGANPGNPYDHRNRAALRELRNMFEREAAITTIALGARRG